MNKIIEGLQVRCKVHATLKDKKTRLDFARKHIKDFARLTCTRMMGASQCKQIMNQKHTAKATGEFLKVKKWDNLQWQILNTNLNAERSTTSN